MPKRCSCETAATVSGFASCRDDRARELREIACPRAASSLRYRAAMRSQLCLVLMCAIGCGGGYSAGGGGDFGATPGGVKDLHLARALVAKGMVPPADALLVEAMFAEHDLGLEGAACDRTLCLRAA